jgi:hypothetical protein
MQTEYKGGAAEHQEDMVGHVTLNKNPQGEVKEIHTASVALSAAVAAQPPKLLSKNMIQWVCSASRRQTRYV